MLKLFAEGVNKVGDKGIVHEGMTYSKTVMLQCYKDLFHEHGKRLIFHLENKF